MKSKKFGLGRSITIVGLGMTGAIVGRFTDFVTATLFIVSLAIIITGIFLEIRNQSKD